MLLLGLLSGYSGYFDALCLLLRRVGAVAALVQASRMAYEFRMHAINGFGSVIHEFLFGGDEPLLDLCSSPPLSRCDLQREGIPVCRSLVRELREPDCLLPLPICLGH